MTYQKRTVRELKCAHCSSDFTASRFDAKYCSRSCAVLAKRESKRLELITKPEPIQQQTEEEKNPHLIFFRDTEWDLSKMDLDQCERLIYRMEYDNHHRHSPEEMSRTYSRLNELKELNRQQKLKDKVLGKRTKK